MSVSKEEYGRMAKRAAPRSPVLADCLWAFFVGGLICALAEGIYIWMDFYGLSEKEGRSVAMIAIIVLTAILTAVGVFDNIAKHAGAGTMVPISGFANSVVAPALEFRAEGRITGTAAQMFSIAGPVIVFGCSSAALYGLIIYFIG
jgi:stage V sporulation protein AC